MKKEYGCSQENCDKYSWPVQQDFDGTVDAMAGNYSEVMFAIPKDTVVQVTREVMAYTFANFVADFGGYLGLLLGASLMSIYDDVLACLYCKVKMQVGHNSK